VRSRGSPRPENSTSFDSRLPDPSMAFGAGTQAPIAGHAALLPLQISAAAQTPPLPRGVSSARGRLGRSRRRRVIGPDERGRIRGTESSWPPESPHPASGSSTKPSIAIRNLELVRIEHPLPHQSHNATWPRDESNRNRHQQRFKGRSGCVAVPSNDVRRLTCARAYPRRRVRARARAPPRERASRLPTQRRG
jgi:hypothetical protein